MGNPWLWLLNEAWPYLKSMWIDYPEGLIGAVVLAFVLGFYIKHLLDHSLREAQQERDKTYEQRLLLERDSGDSRVRELELDLQKKGIDTEVENRLRSGRDNIIKQLRPAILKSIGLEGLQDDGKVLNIQKREVENQFRSAILKSIRLEGLQDDGKVLNIQKMADYSAEDLEAKILESVNRVLDTDKLWSELRLFLMDSAEKTNAKMDFKSMLMELMQDMKLTLVEKWALIGIADIEKMEREITQAAVDSIQRMSVMGTLNMNVSEWFDVETFVRKIIGLIDLQSNGLITSEETDQGVELILKESFDEQALNKVLEAAVPQWFDHDSISEKIGEILYQTMMVAADKMDQLRQTQ